jgi:hypothetical protein
MITTKTKLVFTCLPRSSGGTSTTARVTVFVSPRLELFAGPASDPPPASLTLADFPALGTWPLVVGALAPALMIDGVPVAATLAVPRPGEELDAQLWRDLFPPDATTVVPFVVKLHLNRQVRSYPAAGVAAALHELHATAAATSGGTTPMLATGAAMASHLDLAVADLNAVAQALFPAPGVAMSAAMVEALLTGHGAARDARARALFDANAFHTRAAELPVGPPRPPRNALDFHQLIGGLADHPTLLYRLGLAFDVIVPRAALAATGWLQFTATWRGQTQLDVCPRTHYTVASGTFSAMSQTGEVEGGCLPLGAVDANGPIFEILQLDTDGGALQILDYAGTVTQQATDPRGAPQGSAALPTLRTAGISISHRDRAAWLTARWERAGALEIASQGASPIIDVYAEDLLRGWRLDVAMDDGPWRSLCERTGTVTVAGRAFPVAISEGYVKLASGTSAGTGPDDPLHLHEIIAGWDGWSLVARKPGKALRHDADLGRDVVDDQANRRADGPPIVAEYQPRPGSLPRLRFGHRYRVRVRAVDLAGGSLDKDDPDSAHASAEVTYRRYEPVPPPVLVPDRAYREAESLENLAIRYTDVDEASDVGAVDTCVRHVLPPKGSLEAALTHGKLDEALGPDAPASLWHQLATCEQGSLLAPSYVDLPTGTVRPTGLLLQHPPSAVPETPAARLPARGLAPESGQYVIHPGAEVPVPYLPDPLATGVALWDPASGDGDALVYGARAVPLSPSLADWPVKRSARIVLVASADDQLHPPQLIDGELRCAVPRGRRLTLRYSSLPAGQLDHLALFHQVQQLAAVAAPTTLTPTVLAGRHEAFTPARDLTLVHAVQRPVSAPELPALQASRDPDDTTVRLDGALAVHGWSTSHVDVHARWLEWFEDPTTAQGVRLEPRTAEVGRLAITDGATLVPLAYEAAAVQRTVATTPTGGAEVSTAYPEAGKVRRPLRLELGDTRRRSLACSATGTSRYQEYFPAAQIATPHWLERTGADVLVTAASTARPAPPAVLYAVPTFGWDDASPDGRRRRGKGLRLYLDRPWFQTGEGERLAIVCARTGASPPAELVSAWGADPAWSAAPPPVVLDQAIAVNLADTVSYAHAAGTILAPRVITAELSVDALTGAAPIGEVPTTPSIAVFGFLPEWNRDRGLWFVDVELETADAYWPFVRLAVARWQPESVGPAFSRVVKVEFAQVAPDRTVFVTTSPARDRVDIRLVGVTAGNALEELGTRPGPSRQFGKRGPVVHPETCAAAHRVYARVETRPAGATGELAWTAAAAPLELSARSYSPTEVQWSGSLALTPSGQARVVVTEAEVFPSDTGAAHDPYPFTTPSRERVVFIYQQPV